MVGNENEIAKLEHDETYHVKKVAPYLSDGNGNLVRQNIGGFNLPLFDYVSMALSAGDTTETYTFKTGGSAGTTVATITVVYTTSTRDIISNVTKV